jgi:hypothetical protein
MIYVGWLESLAYSATSFFIMQVKVADMGIFKEWTGSFKDFMAVAKAPGGAAPSDDPKVLTKWMVSSMWVLIIAYIINIAYFAVSGGDIVAGVIAFVQFAISTFIQTWVFWFAFVKREPPCCCLCVVCLEDFKPMHLIAGVFFALKGILEVINAIQNLLPLLSAITAPATLVYIVFVVFYVLYAVCMLMVGVCLIKVGGKKAGVEVPGA